jgi:hypothetical protein
MSRRGGSRTNKTAICVHRPRVNIAAISLYMAQWIVTPSTIAVDSLYGKVMIRALMTSAIDSMIVFFMLAPPLGIEQLLNTHSTALIRRQEAKRGQ